MARCIICDFCDTAGSLSRTSVCCGTLYWDDTLNGYICDQCRDDLEEEDVDDEV